MAAKSADPPANRRFYVDSSAYVCILLGETGSAALAREVEGAQLLSSSLLVLETRRTLIRLARERSISTTEFHQASSRLQEDLMHFALRDLTLDLCGDAPMPIVSTPRSLDLAHLRTALWFHEREPLRRFVSTDDAQNQAARELGLPT
ncbi:MAG: hypothetical protein AABZ30_10515 [Myxococcota bacterium]